jgi:hypothetical protein
MQASAETSTFDARKTELVRRYEVLLNRRNEPNPNRRHAGLSPQYAGRSALDEAVRISGVS